MVNEVVESGSMQYAVIAGLHTETGIERLVIAYPNEESLRDLIAASSIIAAGFSSPEEAAADGNAAVPAAVGRQERQEGTASRRIERRRQVPDFAETREGQGSVFRKLAGFIVSSYSEIAATVFVIFSSRNAVSAVLRMALGSSL